MGGHLAIWDAHFASLFAARGFEPVIYAHGHFPHQTLEGFPVVRQFTMTSWHEDNQEDILKNWDNYFVRNRRMLEDMTRLSQGIYLAEGKGFAGPAPDHQPVGPDDVVIFPTILEYQLTGAIKWLLNIEKGKRPTVFFYLMGPSGSVLDPESGAATIYSLDTARFYKLAFREMDAAGERAYFFGCGSSHAAQYSYLREKPVEAYPVLGTAIQPSVPPREDTSKRVLLYAGTPTPRKGAHLLPDIIGSVAPQHRDWHFTVQMGNGAHTRESVTLHNTLTVLAPEHENVSYLARILSTTNYCRQFNDSEIVVAPYDPEVYFNTSSGIVWEAIATANILVVPANCWLAREAERLGAAYVCFDSFTAEAVSTAVSKAISDPPLPREARIAAAMKFKQQNRTEILTQQIFDRWAGQAPGTVSDSEMSADRQTQSDRQVI